MARGPRDMLFTVDAVLDMADVLEDRRAALERGEALGDIEDDLGYQVWQRLNGDLSADVRVEDDLRYATIEEAVKLVQAVLEAAHVHYSVPREELLQRAREDGPPSDWPLLTPASR